MSKMESHHQKRAQQYIAIIEKAQKIIKKYTRKDSKASAEGVLDELAELFEHEDLNNGIAEYKRRFPDNKKTGM